MAQGAPRVTLGQSVVAIVIIAIVMWEIPRAIAMSGRHEWLTDVMVASGPIPINTAVDPGSLRHRLTLVDRRRALLRSDKGASQFFTKAAADRCSSECAEIVLMKDDVASRPEVKPGTEMWKAVVAEPWSIDDFAVGDQVYVALTVAAPAPSAAPLNAPNPPSDSARTGDAPRVPSVKTSDQALAPTGRQPDDVVPMEIVGRVPKSADRTAAVFVRVTGGLDARRLERLRTGSLRVMSIAR